MPEAKQQIDRELNEQKYNGKPIEAVFEDDLRAHHKPLRRKMFSAVRHLVSENRYYRLRKKYVRRLLHSGK